MKRDAVCDVISTRRTEETWEGDGGDPTRAVEYRSGEKRLHVNRCEHGVGPGAGGPVRSEASLQREARPDQGHQETEEIHQRPIPESDG